MILGWGNKIWRWWGNRWFHDIWGDTPCFFICFFLRFCMGQSGKHLEKWWNMDEEWWTRIVVACLMGIRIGWRISWETHQWRCDFLLRNHEKTLQTCRWLTMLLHHFCTGMLPFNRISGWFGTCFIFPYIYIYIYIYIYTYIYILYIYIYIYWEQSSQLTHIFQRGRLNHQPDP